jgi:quercetin dioxygenase-like cupin family protein
MKISSLDTTPAISPALDAHIMHTSSTLEVVHLHLMPGQVIPQHVKDIDAVMCLMEGSVTIESENEKYSLQKFDLIEIPKGVQRGVVNSGDGDARILVLKKF